MREGQRVVMVLNGMTSMKQRSSESRRLMDLMFREFRQYRFSTRGRLLIALPCGLAMSHGSILFLRNLSTLSCRAPTGGG